VVEALTEISNPRDYWFKIKQRIKSGDQFQLSTNCRQLKLIDLLRWEKVQYRLRQCTESFAYHPINPVAQGRAIQAMAGKGRLRAHPGDDGSGAEHRPHKGQLAKTPDEARNGYSNA